jgi:hypothetical protein
MGTTFRDFHHEVGRISRRFGDVFTMSAPKSLFKLDTYIFTPLTLDLYATGIQAATLPRAASAILVYEIWPPT